jgi:hypothetical protein
MAKRFSLYSETRHNVRRYEEFGQLAAAKAAYKRLANDNSVRWARLIDNKQDPAQGDVATFSRD